MHVSHPLPGLPLLLPKDECKVLGLYMSLALLRQFNLFKQTKIVSIGVEPISADSKSDILSIKLRDFEQAKRSWRDLNSHLPLRRRKLYPLSYSYLFFIRQLKIYPNKEMLPKGKFKKLSSKINLFYKAINFTKYYISYKENCKIMLITSQGQT